MIKVKCLLCIRTIQIREQDKLKMTGTKKRKGLTGWYHNGLGYDIDTGETKAEFFLCPRHNDNESVRAAVNWAREQLGVTV